MASTVFSSRSTLLRRYSFPGGLVNKAFGGGVVHRRQNGHELKETKNFQTFLYNGHLLHLLHANYRIYVKTNFAISLRMVRRVEH